MGCVSCSSNGLPKGCKNNGACSSGGCEKLSVFDWLGGMELPVNRDPFDHFEVRFKNGRKEFFKNVNALSLQMGDIVAVESSPGHDVGIISLSGELVRLQMKKKDIRPDGKDVRKIYRKASQKDVEIWQASREREHETMMRSREIARDLKLQMKISDVEFQGDGAKAIFYYTADDRVDFRELIRKLAAAFKIRVEMRQIGSRQEAGRVGGIGSCGRELCCSTWLSDFRSVNTSAARYQQLALNPQKLAGQCGKLKCCLNYELDTYVEALRNFPDTGVRLSTKRGDAMFQKMDIFKEKLWYSYLEGGAEWVCLDVDKVKKIIEANKKSQKPDSLEMYTETSEVVAAPDYDNVVGQDSLTRFDQKQGKRKKRRKPQRRNKQQQPKRKNG